MGFTFTAKAKPKSNSNSSSSENWGMGLLLVFFSESDNSNGNTGKNNASVVDQTNNLLMPSSPSPSPSPSPHSSSPLNYSSPITRMRRTNSSSRIFTKAQSTISICALLVFLTLLLFTLSTFEPTIPTPTTVTTALTITSIKTPRRFLSQKSPTSLKYSDHHSPFFSFLKILNTKSSYNQNKQIDNEASSFALQGMGTLYRRGTKAMTDLVVAHAMEDVKEDEFRLFLRVLHRSGLNSKADVAFLFGSSSSQSKFGSVIQEENDSFFKLVNHYKESNGTRKSNSVLGFDVTQFMKPGKKDGGEPLWGKRSRGSNSNLTMEDGDQVELTQLYYGSVVGFEATELDPENSLAGFLEHVPMTLKRWACYPMLLGRVRRNFKHIALVDVKHLLLLGDPLGRVRNKSPESVHILMKQDTSSGKHSKRNSEKTQSHHQANSAIITGGTRGVRRFSSAMLTEIVRAAMQHKKKNSVTESGVLSQLVGNEHILKNVKLITSTESIQDASSLSGLRSHAAAAAALGDYGVMQRGGNSNHDVDYSTIMKIICSCEVDSSVYKNC